MTLNDKFERNLSAWLREEGGHRVPDHLAEVLVQTVATRQRPWWSSLERWLPMTVTFPRQLSGGRRTLPGLLVAALLVLVLAAIVIVAVGSRTAHLPAPFGLARNGSIALSIDGDILVADADGANPHTIVGGATNDFGPWYSHDGSRIAFWRASAGLIDVMVANADGSGVRAISPAPLTDADWFEWSPGDDRMAVVHALAHRRVLTIFDAVGSTAPRTLDVGDVNVDNDAYWLPPDGRELIFSARLVPETKDSAIYAIGADGSGLRTIAPRATDHYMDLAVSPSGTTLAFKNVEPDTSSNGIGVHIHLLNLTTRTDRQVRFDPTATDEHGPVFSPDGSTILLWRELGTEVGDAQLMLAPAEAALPGKEIGPIFRIGSALGYGFSPDGTSAFLLLDDGTAHRMDIATGTTANVSGPITNISSWQRLAP